MNKNKILSTALVVLILLSVILGAIPPVVTEAAYSSSSVASSASHDAAAVLAESLKYDFSNASELLEYELAQGYLDYVSSAGNKYTLYINRYTGYVYYVNNATGEILTSNPYNPYAGGSAAPSEDIRYQMMSQILISYANVASSSEIKQFNSAKMAAAYSQISVSRISGGLRVNYIIGDTTTRFLLPGQILAEEFENDIYIPMVKYYESLLNEYVTPENGVEYDIFSVGSYDNQPIYADGVLDRNVIKKYLQSTDAAINATSHPKYIKTWLVGTRSDVQNFFFEYTCQNPNKTNISQTLLDRMHNNYPITKDGIAIYTFPIAVDDASVQKQRKYSTILRTYCPDYTFQAMYEAEAKCSYTAPTKESAIFRCTLEYTFNTDGTLSVRLPANSINFDETEYILQSISPLPFFGASSIKDTGYVFVPDGSGSILEFDDFYNANIQRNVSIKLTTYGKDYCYSKITGAHKEQVTMPVYGMISSSTTTPETQAIAGVGSKANSGFFAILEEGASLANICVDTAISSHPYVLANANFNPYPSDQFSLSKESSSSYTMVSESKYTGSYVTRYVMLSDAAVVSSVGGGNVASYTGMATYYREYLKASGVLSKLETLSETLPLYVEALGSMEMIEKILTFPVTVDVPLTSFEDVVTMYDLLADAKAEFVKEAERYDALAAAEEDDMSLKAHYENKADEFRRLSEEVYNISNVNFRLTGFANDGMYYTYPVKLRWERCLGGKSGFRELLDEAEKRDGLGVYPEFDFMYINNTALFDGIGYRNNVSRMVDNRYASKQIYNAVSGEFETFFAMVISPDALDRLYSRFLKKYSKYDALGLSASTLGSDLNSNFDEDNPINRDDAQTLIEELLGKMSSKYSMMLSGGNIYSVKYADHIVDMCTDSSHLVFSSYYIPFAGMVLHSYVNYAGTAMNYEGTPDYALLHAIENGASLYYTLCYQNTDLMKEDELLNKYYGVDFTNLYFTIVEQYSKVNKAIGDLQGYEIVDHKTLIAERIIDASERIANENNLKDEMLLLVEKQIIEAVNSAYNDMNDGSEDNFGRGIKLAVDTAAIITETVELLNIPMDELKASDFDERLEAIADKYEALYNSSSVNPYQLSFASVDYKTEYNYVTDSFATDADYDKTDYTSDGHLVTMVTYRDSETGDEVVFIINYNIYSVTVRLDSEHTYEIGKYGYLRID